MSEDITVPPAKVLKVMGITKDEFIAMKLKERAGQLEQDLKDRYNAQFIQTQCSECSILIDSPVIRCWTCSMTTPVNICIGCKNTKHRVSENHITSLEPIEPAFVESTLDIATNETNRSSFTALLHNAFMIFSKRPLWAIDAAYPDVKALCYHEQLKDCTFPELKIDTDSNSNVCTYRWLRYEQVHSLATTLYRNMIELTIPSGPSFRIVMSLNNGFAAALIFVTALVGAPNHPIPVTSLSTPFLNVEDPLTELKLQLLTCTSQSESTITFLFCHSDDVQRIKKYTPTLNKVIVVDVDNTSELKSSCNGFEALASGSTTAPVEQVISFGSMFCDLMKQREVQTMESKSVDTLITLFTSGSSAGKVNAGLSLPKAVAYNSDALYRIVAKPAILASMHPERPQTILNARQTHNDDGLILELGLSTLQKSNLTASSYGTLSGSIADAQQDLPLPSVDIVHEPLSHLNGISTLFTNILRGGRALLYSHVNSTLVPHPNPSLWQVCSTLKPSYLAAVPRIWEDALKRLNSLVQDIQRFVYSFDIVETDVCADLLVDQFLIAKARHFRLPNQGLNGSLGYFLSSCLKLQYKAKSYTRISPVLLSTLLKRLLLNWFRSYVLGPRIKTIAYGSALTSPIIKDFMMAIRTASGVPVVCQRQQSLDLVRFHLCGLISECQSLDLILKHSNLNRFVWIPLNDVPKITVPIEVRELYGCTERGTLLVNGKPLPGVRVRLMLDNKHLKEVISKADNTLELLKLEGENISEGIPCEMIGEIQVCLVDTKSEPRVVESLSNTEEKKIGEENQSWMRPGDVVCWKGMILEEQVNSLKSQKPKDCVSVEIKTSNAGVEENNLVGTEMNDSISVVGRLGDDYSIRTSSGEFVDLQSEEMSIFSKLENLGSLKSLVDYVQLVLYNKLSIAAVFFDCQRPDEGDFLKNVAEDLHLDVSVLEELVKASESWSQWIVDQLTHHDENRKPQFSDLQTLRNFSRAFQNILPKSYKHIALWLPFFSPIFTKPGAVQIAQSPLSKYFTTPNLKPRRQVISASVGSLIDALTINNEVVSEVESSHNHGSSVARGSHIETFAHVLGLHLSNIEDIRRLAGDSMSLRGYGLDSISAQMLASELSNISGVGNISAASLMSSTMTLEMLASLGQKSSKIEIDLNSCQVNHPHQEKPIEETHPTQEESKVYGNIETKEFTKSVSWWEEVSLANKSSSEILKTIRKRVPTNVVSEDVIISASNKIFLTGATGFLGAHTLVSLIHELSESSSNDKIVAHVRQSCSKGDAESLKNRVLDNLEWYGLLSDSEMPLSETTPIQVSRSQFAKYVEIISGDLASFQLGLSIESYLNLAAGLATIVHVAAYLNHTASFSELRKSNGDEVALNLLALCLSSSLLNNQNAYAKDATKIVLVSTVDTVNPNSNPLRSWTVQEIAESFEREHDLKAPDLWWSAIGNRPQKLPIISGYASSKWLGEQVFMHGANALNVSLSIVKPGHIGPSSRTGSAPKVSDLLLSTIRTMFETKLIPPSLLLKGLRLLFDESQTVNVFVDLLDKMSNSYSIPPELDFNYINVVPVDTVARSILKLVEDTKKGTQFMILTNPKESNWSYVCAALIHTLREHSPNASICIASNYLEWVSRVISQQPNIDFLAPAQALSLSKLTALPNLTTVVDKDSINNTLGKMGNYIPQADVEYWKRHLLWMLNQSHSTTE